MGKHTITIREALRKLSLPDENALHTAILTQPFFLPAWAEFRDDLLWGKPDSSGLSGHIFLKCVVPAAVHELLNPDGPSEYYIPHRLPRPDKTPYIPSDHYVRLILLTLPPLREPGRLFHARARDEHDLAAAVDALGYLVHVLRNQYRPGNAGQLSRTLQRLAPASRHAARAAQFANPRCGPDAASGRAATDDGPAATASGTDAWGLAARRAASADPTVIARGGQRAAPAAAAPPLLRRFPPPPLASTPRLDRHRHQQEDRRQHQQHGPAALAAPGLPCSPSPSAASAPALRSVMAVSARRFKRSRSEEEGEAGLHDVPAKTSRIGAGADADTNTDTGARAGERDERREERTLEEVLFRDDEGAVGTEEGDVMGGVGKLAPRQLVLLEQVRLAGRGYGDAERGVGGEGRREVWRRRCEGVLQELRGQGGEDMEAVWEGLEEVKKEWVDGDGRFE